MTRSVQIPDPRIICPPEHTPGSSMVFAQNTIEIAATPDRVWSLLIDCLEWPLWYRHCSDVSVLRGGPLLSANSKFRFKTLNFYFEPDMETFEPSRMLVWSAKGPARTSGAQRGTSNRRLAAVVSSQKKHRGACCCFFCGRVRAVCSSRHTRNGFSLSKSWRKRSSRCWPLTLPSAPC